MGVGVKHLFPAARIRDTDAIAVARDGRVVKDAEHRGRIGRASDKAQHALFDVIGVDPVEAAGLAVDDARAQALISALSTAATRCSRYTPRLIGPAGSVVTDLSSAVTKIDACAENRASFSFSVAGE